MWNLSGVATRPGLVNRARSADVDLLSSTRPSLSSYDDTKLTYLLVVPGHCLAPLLQHITMRLIVSVKIGDTVGR